MDKVLRVLVILILILSGVSLFFATQLFQKRELLTKRNNLLEEQFVRLGRTIEAETPAATDAPTIMKDVSEVSDRELDNPERLSVLEGYPMALEQANLPTLDYSNVDKRIQLKRFYAVDAEGNYELDPVDNRPRSRGPGTMQELMDEILDRAQKQQASLNQTRSELTKMRENVTTAVDEINKLKSDGRVTKVELTEERGKVANLTEEKFELETQVAKLNAEKRELNAEIANLQDEVETLNEDNLALTEDLSKSKEYAKQLEERLKTGTGPRSTGTAGDMLAFEFTPPTAGVKGKILEVNDELKFAVVELNEDAMLELLGPERANPLPQLEMNVKRSSSAVADSFVTRIKLRQAVRGKNLIVADILNDWQQEPVAKNDVVYF